MKFFKNIRSTSAYHNQTFPKATKDGSVEIVGNKIVCTGNDSFRNCQVNIEDLQYVYLVVNRNKESLLFLFDHHQSYVPTSYSGFKEVYLTLSKNFGFDDQTFFDHVHKKTETKKEIWRKVYPANFEILNEGHTDYGLGFEIRSPEKEFIYWDTTYDQLKKNQHLFFEESPYGQQISKFKYPIRIGNIVLKDFQSYFDNSRTDVPVLHFYTHCMDAGNSDKSYYQIKERYLKDFKPANTMSGYERDDQNSVSFKAGNMLFSLVYTYDSPWQFDGGYTLFSVKNQREYPNLLVDQEYESNMEVSGYLEFKNDVRTSGDYKRNPKVKRRPKNLMSDKPLIWMDDKNNKIGFADKSYAQTFQKETIKHFTIQNILPAKGGGGGYLEINFKDNSTIYSILIGKCKVFDIYKNQIEKLTGLEVIMAPEYHDC